MNVEFRVQAKVKVTRVSINDNGNKYSNTLVLLIPQESSELIRFYDEWLPSVSDENPEFTGRINTGGVSMPSRMCLSRGSKFYHEPYILAMSVGASNALKTRALNSSSPITVLLEIFSEDVEDI